MTTGRSSTTTITGPLTKEIERMVEEDQTEEEEEASKIIHVHNVVENLENFLHGKYTPHPV